MFPDRAALYVVAIEDRQYKDFKIHCKSHSGSLSYFHCVLGVRETSGWVVHVLGEFFCDPFWILLWSSLLLLFQCSL